MTERSFIDTNVLIYAEASDAPGKIRKMREDIKLRAPKAIFIRATGQ